MNVNKRKLVKRSVLIGAATLILIPVVSYLLFWTGPAPLCHRGLDAAFQQWMLETYGRTNTEYFFPNTNGNGIASLDMIDHLWGPGVQEYAYVPGLRLGDPQDLVLMYMKRKTHHTWHGDAEHSIFSPSRWMVVSPEILTGSCPEGGELVETPELKRRLMLTITYLKEHQRPYWQAVTDEQLAFLESIKE
jgi:hypothetical protein